MILGLDVFMFSFLEEEWVGCCVDFNFVFRNFFWNDILYLECFGVFFFLWLGFGKNIFFEWFNLFFNFECMKELLCFGRLLLLRVDVIWMEFFIKVGGFRKDWVLLLGFELSML